MRSPTSPLSSSDWPDHVAQQRAPLALLELGAGEQDLHVGAQRGHRGAQLVRGVGHEPALGGLRGLHAVEHGVEALRHAPDLVLAARPDAATEVAGGLDVLGRARELGDRAGSTGRAKRRAISAANAVPASTSSASTIRRRPSTASTLSSERPSCTAPRPSIGTVMTRRCTPSAVRSLRNGTPAARPAAARSPLATPIGSPPRRSRTPPSGATTCENSAGPPARRGGAGSAPAAQGADALRPARPARAAGGRPVRAARCAWPGSRPATPARPSRPRPART